MNHGLVNVVKTALGVVLLGALVVGTTGCGATEISAVSVDGHHVSQSSVDDELKALRDNRQLRDILDRQGQTVSETPSSVTSSISSGWVSAIVQDELIKIAMARRHVKVSASDHTSAVRSANQAFGSKAVFDAFPKFFRDAFVARRARAIALAGDAGADLTTQDGVNTLVAVISKVARHTSVSVDPRYGTWNVKRLEVTAPRAPGAVKP